MTVSELIEELAQYDPDLEVGIVVSYTEHSTDCGSYEYGCYCSSKDHEHYIESVSKEEDPKKKIVKKLWIRGG